jgi:hypothetical protein
MYGLEAPGISINDVEPPGPDPLAASRYPCVYYINHLCDSKPISRADNGNSLRFTVVITAFIREKYLYWPGGFSLYKSVAKGVVSVARLCSVVQLRSAQTIRL